MNCHATLITESNDAQAVEAALNVDNVELDQLDIKCSVSKCQIVTEVKATSIGTLLSTVDDILRCQITAESLM